MNIFDEATKIVLNRIRSDGTFASFKKSKKFRKWLLLQKKKKIEEVIERVGGLLEDDN